MKYEVRFFNCWRVFGLDFVEAQNIYEVLRKIVDHEAIQKAEPQCESIKVQRMKNGKPKYFWTFRIKRGEKISFIREEEPIT